MANERRLIDVSATNINKVLGAIRVYPDKLYNFLTLTKLFPEINAVEVVFCKDCKHAEKLGEAEKKIYIAECLICRSGEATLDGYNIVMSDHFCSYGKKSGTQPQREVSE